jgi:hypothetical protein
VEITQIGPVSILEIPPTYNSEIVDGCYGCWDVFSTIFLRNMGAMEEKQESKRKTGNL